MGADIPQNENRPTVEPVDHWKTVPLLLVLVVALPGCYRVKNDGAACECHLDTECQVPDISPDTSTNDREETMPDTGLDTVSDHDAVRDADTAGRYDTDFPGDTYGDTTSLDTTDRPPSSDTTQPAFDTDDPCYLEERDMLRERLESECTVQQNFKTISLDFNENGFISDVNVDIDSDVTKHIEELISCYMDILLTAQFPCLANLEVVVHP